MLRKLAYTLIAAAALPCLTLLALIVYAKFPRTEYAHLYNERVFDDLALPASRSAVLEALGCPLELRPVHEIDQNGNSTTEFMDWMYARPLRGEFRQYDAWVRYIRFSTTDDTAIKKGAYYNAN